MENENNENKLFIFNNGNFGSVRAMLIDDEPWFVGKDVAEALGYKDTDAAIRMHVDDEDKLTRQFIGSGQARAMTIINESGLYSLVLSSKLPSAKQFKRWITHEVIPSIRKTGSYQLNAPSYQIKDPIERAKAWIKEQEEKKALEDKNKEQQKALEVAKPKIVFADAVSVSTNSILIFDLAKLLKQNGVEIGGRLLFEKLREGGYLIKSGSSKNMPTQRAMDMGLFVIKEGSYINGQGVNVTTKTTKVTGKGQLYFINKFLSGDLKKAE